MARFPNPFPNDPDRSAIWTMLVERDIAAFVAGDWGMVADDFVAEQFLGIDGCGSDNPDSWRVGFPTLAAYREEWLRQAAESAKVTYAEDREAAIHRATTLRDIEIAGDIALAHKKFDGTIARADGGKDVLNWQTLYYCRRDNGRWKLTGFTGYLPFPMGRPA
jgi:ketosteroid isomerase-like protein